MNNKNKVIIPHLLFFILVSGRLHLLFTYIQLKGLENDKNLDVECLDI